MTLEQLFELFLYCAIALIAVSFVGTLIFIYKMISDLRFRANLRKISLDPPKKPQNLIPSNQKPVNGLQTEAKTTLSAALAADLLEPLSDKDPYRVFASNVVDLEDTYKRGRISKPEFDKRINTLTEELQHALTATKRAVTTTPPISSTRQPVRDISAPPTLDDQIAAALKKAEKAT